MLLQRSSISKQESSYLQSLKLLRIVVAVTAVTVADDCSMMLTHAAACVVSMLLQCSSISKQGGSDLPSLKLLRIVVAVTAVTVAADALARCCVRRFNAVAAQQHVKAGGL